MTYIFYSKTACDGHGLQKALELAQTIEGGAEVRALQNFDLADLFSVVNKEDTVILLGGDGTINRFINSPTMYPCAKQVFYAAGGTGNDFYLDVRDREKSDVFPLTRYLQKLPAVQFNDRYFRFVNGVGFGLDGYCCEVLADRRAKGKTPPSYVKVAFHGVLYKYKPVSATVTVDGVTHWFKNVYIATTMFGRYYGGGVKIAPDRSRDDTQQVSVVVIHSKSRLKILPIFTTIFKGTHVKFKKHVKVLTGNEITVAFDRACAMQVDGEVFHDVSTYTVTAAEPLEIEEEAETAAAAQ